jgi:replicative DNA helicase
MQDISNSDKAEPVEPPRDSGTELGLLGACLTNADAIDQAAVHVDSSDFGDKVLGLCWDVLQAQRAEGIQPTPRLLLERIKSAELLKALGTITPAQLIGAMVREAAVPLQAADYAKMIRETANRRRLIAAAQDLSTAMANPLESFRDSVAKMTDAAEQALKHAQAPRRTMLDLVTASTAALDPNRKAPGITTGLRDVNKILGGFVGGDLIVLGARPSMGKSTVGVSHAVLSSLAGLRAYNDGGDDPWGVLFLTHEMTQEQVAQRCLASLAFQQGDPRNPLEYERFRPAPGQSAQPLTAMQHSAYLHAAELLPKLPLRIDGQPGMKITEVTALIRQHKKWFAGRGMKLRLVVVDHIGLGKIVAVGRSNNPVTEIGEITSSLKAAAVNEDLACLALHQLSRANEGRENKRPTLADFRDSGHIEQDADAMVGLYRDSYYLERAKESDQSKEISRVQQLQATRHDLEYHVLKNRQGRVGHVSLWAHMGANAVLDNAPASYSSLT